MNNFGRAQELFEKGLFWIMTSENNGGIYLGIGGKDAVDWSEFRQTSIEYLQKHLNDPSYLDVIFKNLKLMELEEDDFTQNDVSKDVLTPIVKVFPLLLSIQGHKGVFRDFALEYLNWFKKHYDEILSSSHISSSHISSSHMLASNLKELSLTKQFKITM